VIVGRGRAASLALALATIGCYPTGAPDALTEGVWSGGDGAEQFVFEFTGSHLGAHAVVHVMRGGRKITEKPAKRTWVDMPRLEVRVDDRLSYRGRIDLKRKIIEGEIVDAPSTPRKYDLEWVASGTVPGLLARPAPRPDEPVYDYARPPTLDDGWPTATPEEVGIDPVGIREFVEDVIAGEAGVIHSLLVVRHGKLVLEEYFHGYGRDDLHGIASCTKSVASLLVGIAIDQARIEGVAAPVLDFFPEQRTGARQGWDQVSLEHLLTMTVGRSHAEWRRTGAVECAETPYHHVLTEGVTGSHGVRWQFGDRDVNLLAGVLRHATGLHADEFAAMYLFRPLAIEVYDWSAGKKNGFPMLHGTLRLRPRDLAKIGTVVLEGGRWQGRQVVSDEWIRTSTRSRFRTTGSEEYGYLWWLSRLADDSEQGEGVIFASGWGSQFVYALPASSTTVVVTGGNEFNGKTRDHRKLLVEQLIPAVRS
jgi:CubicO group peptidase (beta-lactamase class C family)